VRDSNGNPKEELKKVHNGVKNECFTRGDKYVMTLPADEVDAALMLAALQHIDMLFFENPYDCCDA
jgi:hypothetical protein